MGVSFSRIPGGPVQGPPAQRLDGGPTLDAQLVANGVDFVWQAADGSTAIAHYMQQHYGQGSHINQGSALVNIQSYLDKNQPSAPTPYIYVPCGDDFKMPTDSDLLGDAASWNSAYFRGRPQDVYAVVATLDHYIQLISTYIDPTVQHNYGPYKNLVTMPFFPTPYWTGFYASRIRNKILHQAATRALLGAETFAAVADLLESLDGFGFQWLAKGRQDAIWDGWKALVPSTHHDYISGTAKDPVSTTEQVPLLAGTLALAEGARSSAIEQIATQVSANPKPEEIPVVIFNQLGYTAKGPCTLPPLPGFAPQSIRFEDASQSPVQIAHDGHCLFLGAAPSLGYQAGYLSPASVTPADTARITSPDGGATWTLQNGALTAIIAGGQWNWAISSLVDNATRQNLVPNGQVANYLQFFIDGGGIYRFGNENGSASDLQPDPNGTLSTGACEVLENGPVRVWLRTTVTFISKDARGNAISGTYVRDYILVAGESFLRMTFSGAAPLTKAGGPNSNDWNGNQYALMALFPFALPGSSSQGLIDNLTFGTPYYWVTQMPVVYWAGPIFQPMHDFVLPQAKGSVLGAIYQSTIPAWALDATGRLIGCLLRNTPRATGDNYGADGQDTETHTHHYAIRVPSGIQDPKTGAQLQESRAFTTPLRAAYATVPLPDFSGPQFPASFSLASVAPASAIITAAKGGTYDPSSLIFRVYQPTTSALDVTVTLASEITNQSGVEVEAQLVTALETSIDGSQPVPINNSTVAFPVPLALATLRVGPVSPTSPKPATN
jgi:alpha-mannosidase